MSKSFTASEYKVIIALVNSDEASYIIDGQETWLKTTDYEDLADETDLSVKQLRGVVASLVKKDVVHMNTDAIGNTVIVCNIA